jgi:hypothetical protein
MLKRTKKMLQVIGQFFTYAIAYMGMIMAGTDAGHAVDYENTLYMEPIDHILNIATNAGFVPNANFSYAENIRHSFKPFGLEDVTGDPHQYLYILERPVS